MTTLIVETCRQYYSTKENHLFGIVLARLTAIQEVPGSIPGYTLEVFLEV